MDGLSPSRSSAALLRSDTDAIVHGSAGPLLAVEITLSYLHGCLSRQELNLVQLFTSGVAHFARERRRL